MRLIAAFALAGICLGQRPARIGPDGKPLLNRPVLDECKKRKSHMKVGNHNYFLSWREPWHKFEDWDWFNGRNFCRDRCMDLVSFETPGEFAMFKEIMEKDNVSSIYTSGRKCNFQNKGCDGAHLQPINVNGWFWAGAKNVRIPATDTPNPDAFWSNNGELGTPQPDNWEGKKEGPIDATDDIGITIEGLQEFHDEACLAVLNNKYNDGVAWHDTACHFRSVIVCEDSDQLITLIQAQEGVDVQDFIEEGTNSIDVDSLPHLPPITAPRPPPPAPPQPQQPPRQQQQQQPQFQQQQEQFQQRPQPQQPQVFQPQRPPPRRPNKRPGVFGGLFSGFRLPFF